MIHVAHSDVVRNVGITSINSANKNFHIFSNGPYIFQGGLLEIPDYIILIIHEHNGKVLGYPHFSAPS